MGDRVQGKVHEVNIVSVVASKVGTQMSGFLSWISIQLQMKNICSIWDYRRFAGAARGSLLCCSSALPVSASVRFRVGAALQENLSSSHYMGVKKASVHPVVRSLVGIFYTAEFVIPSEILVLIFFIR